MESWPRDDAEAKLIVAAIMTYNFNNYKVLKRYHELNVDDKWEMDPVFMVHDPSFLVGMSWEENCPSFYVLSVGSDLVKAVRVGTYPCIPTRVCKYTPVLLEEPDGGMDKLWINVMKLLANWRLVIRCLEAFKKFLRVKRFSVMSPD